MLTFDTSLIFVFCVVWILVLVMSKIFFSPLRKIREKREAMLLMSRQAHQKANDECEMKLAEIQQRLKEARMEAQKLKEKLEGEALREKERILSEISQECQLQMEEARRRLERETQRLKKEITSRSEELAERIEQRVVGR